MQGVVSTPRTVRRPELENGVPQQAVFDPPGPSLGCLRCLGGLGPTRQALLLVPRLVELIPLCVAVAKRS